jgi:hypothetical protein
MKLEDYPLEEDAFEVDGEPPATTAIIPFSKDDIVGRKLHMLFEDGDGHSFYRGIVKSYESKTGKYHVDFWDGDEAELDFVSGGDIILWETREITRDGRWKPVVVDDQDSDIDIGSTPEKRPTRAVEIKVPPPEQESPKQSPAKDNTDLPVEAKTEEPVGNARIEEASEHKQVPDATRASVPREATTQDGQIASADTTNPVVQPMRTEPLVSKKPEKTDVTMESNETRPVKRKIADVDGVPAQQGKLARKQIDDQIAGTPVGDRSQKKDSKDGMCCAVVSICDVYILLLLYNIIRHFFLRRPERAHQSDRKGILAFS